MIKKILDLIYTDKECFEIISRKIKEKFDIKEEELKRFLQNNSNDLSIINIDGGARGNPGESGIGIVINQNGIKKGYYFYTGFLTNNEAEYNSLIKALQIAKEKGFKKIEINSDSELIVNQINGNYRVKKDNLIELYNNVKKEIMNFNYFKINYVNREKNRDADYLANLAMDLKKDGEIEFTVAE